MTDNQQDLSVIVRALSQHQRGCLEAVDHFKFQKMTARGGWAVGAQRYTLETIRVLRRHGLLIVHGGRLQLTQSGKLALDRIREKQP
ncbi:hypothetical protein [Rhizobium straminoryzae]|uniref:Uncharacterized protein n=1 Tax=Rhizobium straminoryzae TaxID=1387186 RepID=A0A549TCZ9_9HYPH|nr:hypothetical protein [Rhizobium straminoryzae]TRL39855.1 hypothetical protein FNA46_07930 [Rhizobium straminoryzae]